MNTGEADDSRRKNSEAVDRGRVSVRKAQLNRNSSLPEKAEGFTKRSYPEGHMVYCVAL